MSETYIVLVRDTYGREDPYAYGPFHSSAEADEWVAEEQHSEGLVGTNRVSILVLNLP